jgi:succinoglycan biosynthesis protein ExoM
MVCRPRHLKEREMDGDHHESDAIAVVISVLTFRRLERLAQLLPELLAQAADLGLDPVFTTRVLVVDNDPAAGARALVSGFGAAVSYVHEPLPGIAAARARAVSEAGDADVVVFIDDDVFPRPGWLLEMLGTWRRLGRPAGVVGRVCPEHAGAMDAWIAAGGFFTRRSYPTGTRVQAGSSANLLLDLRLLHELDLTFDSRLGLRGGEDTLLTRTITARGHALVWCDEAAVSDVIPPSRLTRQWVLKRAFSHGVVASRVDILLSGHPVRTRIRLALGAVVRVLGGVGQALAGLVTRQVSRHARGYRMAYRGAGVLSGAIGRDVVEYERSAT